MTWLPLVVALIPALVAIIAGLFAWKQNAATATKTHGEAMQIIQDSTLNLIGPMRDQVAALQDDVKALRERVELVEEDRDVLAQAAKIQVKWEDSGRLDPPGAPPMSAKVRAVLDRLHTAA